MYVLNSEERDAVVNWWNGRVHLFDRPFTNRLMFSGWACMDDDRTMMTNINIVPPEGYNVADYFQKVDGVLTFLGPDQDGILPTFAGL